MGFLKTLFTPGSLPAFDASEANKMGQGIADSFGAQQSLNAVQGFSFTGLDGDADYGYELTLLGRINGSTSGTYVIVARPNGDAAQTNYPQTTFKRFYQDPLGTIQDNAFVGEPATVLGMTIARTAFVPQGYMMSRTRLLVPTGVKRMMMSECLWIGNGDNRAIEHLTHCYYTDAATPITSLSLALLTYMHAAPPGDITFTGRAVLKRLTP